jgi:hypothetical protein
MDFAIDYAANILGKKLQTMIERFVRNHTKSLTRFEALQEYTQKTTCQLLWCKEVLE